MEKLTEKNSSTYLFQDFTEENYLRILSLAKSRYKLVPYGTNEMAPHAIWRHDVDVSLHRACKLAHLEASEDIQSTYFLLPHSPYYNLFEKEAYNLVKEMMELGHEIGLHFDAGFYSTHLSLSQLEDKLRFEKLLIENLFKTTVRVFSFHDPDTTNALTFTEDILGGMINTYGKFFKTNYTYCSDSNGYWRFKRLEDVLESSASTNLHILTHPEWWVPIPMSPRSRIFRSIDGRAKNLKSNYDSVLEKTGRRNIGL